MLRAEILDLEDKYFLLKSQYEANIGELNGYYDVSSDGGMLSPDPIVGDGYYDDGEMIYQGDVIYEGPINQGEVINDAGNYQSAPVMSGPNGSSSVGPNGSPTPVGSGSSDIEPGYSIDMQAPNGQGQVDSLQADSMDDIDSMLPDLEDIDSGESVALSGPGQGIGYERSEPDAMWQAEITEVVINRNASRGHDVDGRPGDEGIDLLIQPRDAEGNIELVGGELTVSVLDPTEAPDRQRVGLWKFLPQETELFFANDEIGNEGILLHLPWEQSTPVNERLMVHVRFVTPDGREMKTSSEIRIVPPAPGYSADDPLVAGWTKRDSRWGANLKKASSSLSSSTNSDWRKQQSSGSAGFQSASKFRDNDRSNARSNAGRDRFQRTVPRQRPMVTQQGSQPIPPNGNFSLDRRQVPATPAKVSSGNAGAMMLPSSIEKPAWRPVR
ncbi:MAG: hypothetical protein AB8B55_03315 [Mariniblastus sp.]